jgi:predicted outer membrane protein
VANATSLTTTGDARRLILDTIAALKNNQMPAAVGLAIAANMKVLNDSIQTEINAAKLAIQTSGTAHEFGKVVALGQRLIANESGQSA